MMRKRSCKKVMQTMWLFGLLTWVCATGNAMQQSVTVSGRVTDTYGETLVGVSVLVKGTMTISVTDGDGRYSIRVPSTDAVLSFSYLGYKPYQMEVGDRRVIDVTLEEDAQRLEEVIVTGFGNLKKSQYDGSASVIRTAHLQGIPNQTVNTMIQANAPGVSVTYGSSQPGATSTVRIRGYGSYSGSNTPLWVIDGIPVQSGDVGNTGWGDSGGLDVMATINPNDINNITIIKDAAAASLWGSRAANGVILITTKQGDKNSMRVSFSSDFGKSDFAYTYRPMMDGAERRQFIYDSYVRRGLYVDNLSESEAKAYADAMREADENRSDGRPRWSVEPWSGWTDWRAEAFRKGSHNNQELSVSGGSDRMTYYSSFSHTQSQGIQKNQELDRITGRINVRYDAKNWLRMGGNLMFSDMKQSVGRDDNWYSGPMYAAIIKNTPSDPVYNKDGSYNTVLIGGTSRNIVPVYELNEVNEHFTRAFNTVFMEVIPLPAFSFKTTLAYDFSMNKARTWENPINADSQALNGSATKSYNETRRLTWSSNVSYEKTFGTDHHVDALVAFEVMDNFSENLSGRSTGFIFYDYHEVSSGSVVASVGGSYSQDRMASYISRANYNWKYKYYVGGSLRRDGTSRLHANSRWGNFWSVSAGWRFSEEDFMNGNHGWLTNGKLRISYGVNGNRPSGGYSYLSTISTSSSYNGATALSAGNIANEKLKWESNYTLNAGLDVEIKHRVDLSLEWYDRTTKDLYMSVPISRTTGFSSYTTNVGSMRNRGVELAVNTANVRRNNWSWNTQFNISHNKNVILEMDGTDNADVISTYTIRRIGCPYYLYYMIEFSHVDPETGRPMFFMNNELPDGTINREVTNNGSLATRIAYKSPLPKATMGLTNNIRWKFVDVSFTLSSTLGGYSYDRAADKTETSGAADALVNQLPTFYRDSWKYPGDNAKYEAWIPGNSTVYSMGAYHNTRRVHSTDHLRLKNFTAGISLPRALANAIKVQQLRVYFTGQNLLTFAAHDQYDPEVSSDNGEMWYNSPPMKSYSFGININF